MAVLEEVTGSVRAVVDRVGPAVVGLGRGWGRGSGVVVAPGRVAPLSAALVKLVTTKRLRSAFARRSLRRARQLSTWAASEARFVRAVRRGLGRRALERR